MCSKPDSSFYEPESETISRTELAQLQLQRLRWQLQRCYENSPFHREKFDRAGIELAGLHTLERTVFKARRVEDHRARP